MFKRHLFSASDIFSTSVATGPVGMPGFCDLRVAKRSTESSGAIAGCGLYFLCHKGQLVYIGKFLGSIHNAFAGDIFTARWNRHLSTLSLRGSRISISKAALDKALKEGAPEELNEALQGVDSVILAKDRGFMVPYKRLKYAALHWQDFSRSPDSWLADIQVGYLQLDSSAFQKYSTYALRKMVSAAEDEAIASLPTVLNGPGRFDVQLLKAMSSDQIFERLASTFQTPLKEIVVDTQQGEDAVLEDESELEGQDQTVEAEIESNFYGERFLELLPSDCPEDAVQALYDAFGGSHQVQVHHTKTNGGDLRIRSLNASVKRNVFTMYWQPRLQLFHCRTLLSPDRVCGAGIVKVSASRAGEPLATVFKFDCTQSGGISNLIELVRAAVEAWEQQDRKF
jgi:hypothetical protein